MPTGSIIAPLGSARRPAALIVLSLLAALVAASSAVAHPGHAHERTFGPPAPEWAWGEGPEARQAASRSTAAFRRQAFDARLQAAPLEQDARCEQTATFPDLGDGCRTVDGMLRLVTDADAGTSIVTHGPDFLAALPDTDPQVHPTRMVAAVRTATRDAIHCVWDSSKHVQLVYAIPADGVDRSGDRVDAVRQSLYEASAVLSNEGSMVEPEEWRKLRVACDFEDNARVVVVRLPTRAADATVESVTRDVHAQLGTAPGVGTARPMVFYDAHLGDFAGIAEMYEDDTPDRSNLNNQGGLLAIHDNSENRPGPSWQVMLHELSHMMGAVQPGMPDANGLGHCNDGLDVMCYAEPDGTGTYDPNVCQELAYDCGKDSYFNPAPGGGTPIAMKWNVAAPYNEFIRNEHHAVDTTPPTPPGSLTGVGHGTWVRLSWSGANDAGSGVAGYRIQRRVGASWIGVRDALADASGVDLTWSGIQTGTPYELRVQAFDVRGNASSFATVTVNSGSSDGTSPATEPDAAPGTPSDAHVRSASGTSLTATWQLGSSDPASTTRVEYRVGGTGCWCAWVTTSGSSATITSLTGATRYELRLRTELPDGRASSWIETAGWTSGAPDQIAPSAPVNLTLDDEAGTAPTLSWNPVGDAAHYVVSVNAGAGWTTTTTTTDTSATVTGIAYGASVQLGVQAVDEAGNVSTRSTLSWSTGPAPDVTPPADVTGLVISNVHHTGFHASWNHTTDDVALTGYRVLAARDDNPTWEVMLELPADTNAAIVSEILQPGTTYRVTVAGVDESNNMQLPGSYHEITTLPDDEPPTEPGAPRASLIGGTWVALEWDPSTDNVGVARYELIQEVEGDWWLVGETMGESYSLTNLQPLTEYTIGIRAVDVAGTTSDEVFVTFTTGEFDELPDEEPPTAPSPMVIDLGETSVTLAWQASTDDSGTVERYDVYELRPPLPPRYVDAVTGTSITIEDLDPLTEYTFGVAAVDPTGNDSEFGEVTITTIDRTPPSKPGNLRAVSVGESDASLAWDASTDNVEVFGYRVLLEVNGTYEELVVTSDTSASLSYLETGVEHRIAVEAFDEADNVSERAFITVTTADETAPYDPGPVQVTSVSNAAMALGWIESSDNVAVAGYHVYRVSPSPSSTPILSTGPEATTVTITGLAASTEYTFAVTAYDAAGNESEPAEATGTTAASPDVTPPTDPTNLMVIDASGTTGSIAWDPAWDENGVAGYDVWRVSPSPTVDPVAATSQNGYTLTDLQPGVTYLFEVAARDAAGNRSARVPVTVTTIDDQPPSTPGGLTISDATETSALVTWNPSIDGSGVSTYRVAIHPGEPDADPPEGVLVEELSWLATGLTAGTTYTVYVAALDVLGYESERATLTFTTPDQTPPSAVPSALATSIGTSSVTIAWTAASDNVAVTSYLIERISPSPTELVAEDVTDLAVTVHGLEAGITYTLAVRAVDAHGNVSAPRNVIVTTSTTPDLDAPSTPGAITVSEQTGSSVRLTWGASTDEYGVGGYHVYRLAPAPSPDPIATVSDTTHVIEGLASGTSYLFEVMAFDAAGNLSAPAQTLATTLDTVAPTMPGGADFLALDEERLSLTWSDSWDDVGVVGYEIWQLVDGDPQLLDVTSSEVTWYDVTGLESGVEYEFHVIAVDAAGNRSAPAIIHAMTEDTEPPTAPANPRVTNVTSGEATLAWDAAEDSGTVARYEVYAIEPFPEPYPVDMTSELSVELRGLNEQTDYVYHVIAVDGAGNTSPPAVFTFTTLTYGGGGNDEDPPDAPAGLIVEDRTDSYARVTWVAPGSPDVVGYRVRQIAPTTEPAFEVGDAWVDLSPLEPATTYTFEIRAVDDGGNESAAATITFTTLGSEGDVTPPDAPNPVTASLVTETSARLLWTEPWDDVGVTQYEILRTSPSVSFIDYTEDTSYDLTNLEPGTTYQFQVIAWDGAGNPSAPGLVTFTTAATASDEPPTLSGSITVVEDHGTSLELEWNPAVDDGLVQGYRIRRISPSPSPDPIVQTAATSATVTGLTSATTYEFSVTAYDGAGQESAPLTIVHRTRDVQAPSDPSNVIAAAVTATSAHLMWAPSVDDSPGIEYEIVRVSPDPSGGPIHVTTLTEQVLAALQPATDYVFAVRAVDASGNASNAVQVSLRTDDIPDVTAPSMPPNLVAGSPTDTSVLLTWSASSDDVGVTEYRLYRTSPAPSPTPIATTGTTSLLLEDLEPGITYELALTAVDAAENESVPALVTFTTRDLMPPSVPTGLGVTVVDRSAQVTWNASNDDVAVTGYLVHLERDGVEQLVADVTDTAVTLPDLELGTWVVHVAAHDAAGNVSARANASFDVVDSTAPTVPTNLQIVAAGEASIALSWTASTDDDAVTGYRVWIDDDVTPTTVVTDPTAVLTGLAPARAYVLHVDAVDASGNVSARASIVAATIDETAPTAPAPAAATVAGASSITVSWTAASDNDAVAGYEVTVTSGGTTVHASTTTDLSVTVGSLQPGAFDVTVRAFDPSGNHSPPATASVELSDVTPPTQPGNPHVVAAGETDVTIAWDAATDDVGVVAYAVSVVVDGIPELRDETTGTTSTITGLSAGSSWELRIVARDAAGNQSDPASVIASTTDLTPPSIPGDLLVTSAGEHVIDVSWSASTDNVGVVGYDVFVTDAGVTIHVERTTAVTSSITGLLPARTYEISVVAVDAAGNPSAAAVTTSATVDQTPPSAPPNLAIEVLLDTSVTITWDPATDAVGVTGYEVVLEQGGILGPALPTTDLTSTVTDLTPGASYAIHVRALDAAGHRSVASSRTFTTPEASAPTQPTGLSLVHADEQTLTISWNASTDGDGTVVGYDVLIDDGEQTTLVERTTALTSTITGLSPARTYVVRVVAVDDAGNESPPATRSVATVDLTPPTTPGNLQLTATAEDELVATWDASTDNHLLAGYAITIERDGTVTDLGIVTELTLTIGSLAPATTYAVEVQAVDASGLRSAPTSATATTPDQTAPAAPGAITVVDAGETWATIQWTAAVDNVAVTGYRVYVEVAGTPTLLETISGTATTIVDLEANRSYVVAIEAFDAADNVSDRAVTTIATVDLTPPSSPANLQATATGETTITATWDASTDNDAVTGYAVTIERDGAVTDLGVVTDLTLTITDLAPASTYVIAVQAVDASGLRSAPVSDAATTQDLTPPTTPSALTVATVTDAAVTLTWSASTDNVEVVGYHVLVDGVLAETTTSPTVTLAPLQPATTYEVQVIAIDAASLASAPATITVTTADAPDVTRPSAPTDLVAADVGETSLRLTWTASSDDVGVVAYRVSRLSPAPSGVLLATVTDGTEHQLTGLAPGTTYEFAVTAIDAAGNESDAAQTTAQTTPAGDVLPPSTPTGFAATGITTTTASLAWNPAWDDTEVVGYELRRVAPDPSATPIATPTGTTVTVTDLEPDTTYTFSLVALDAAGNASEAAELTLSTQSLPDDPEDPDEPDDTPPSAPTNVTVTIASGTSIAITWDAATDDVGVVGYQVFRMDPPPVNELVSGSAATSATIGGLQQGTTYTFEIVALDAAGNVSAPASITTATLDEEAPSAPSNLQAVATSESDVTLTWDAATDNVGVATYRVLRDVSGTVMLLGTTAARTWNVTDLTANLTASFLVVAVDAAGNTSTPASVTITTPDQTAPSAPGSPQVLSVSDESLAVGWDAATDNVGVTGYRVYEMPGKVLLETLDEDATSVVLTGLTPGTAYELVITAVDAAGNESPDAPLTATTAATPDETAPTTPGTPAVSGVTTTGATLTWTASSDDGGVAGYRVERLNSGTWTSFAITAIPNYVVTGLIPGTSSTWRVVAFDAAGNESTPSATATITTVSDADMTPPSPVGGPIGFSASADGAVALVWGAASDDRGVVEYVVYRYGSSGATVVARTNQTSVVLRNLPTGQTVNLGVTARDAAGNESTAVSTGGFVPHRYVPPPSQPTGVQVASGTHSLVVSWAPRSGAWFLVTLSHADTRIIETRTVHGTSTTFTGLAPGTAVVMRIVAVSPDGESAPTVHDARTRELRTSTTATKDRTRPTRPGRVRVTVLRGGAVRMRWRAARDDRRLGRYEIQLVSKGRRTRTIRVAARRTSAVVRKLQRHRRYMIRIRATDAAGNRSAWVTLVRRTR